MRQDATRPKTRFYPHGLKQRVTHEDDVVRYKNSPAIEQGTHQVIHRGAVLPQFSTWLDQVGTMTLI